MMQGVVYLSAAVLVGAMISVQPPLNAILARSIGSSVGAATISIVIALVTILLLAPFLGLGRITAQSIAAVPWWVYLAGAAGAIFVAAGVIIAPVTGALAFFVCIVAGQLLGSLIVDHFGAFDLEVREIDTTRLVGLALVIFGAVLVQRG